MKTIITDPLRDQYGSECHSCGGKEYKEYTSKYDTPCQHARVVVSMAGGHEGEAPAHLGIILAVSVLVAV